MITNKKLNNMPTENDLIQKLMVSKKMMEIHNKIPRGQSQGLGIETPEVQEFNAPQANYNIPPDVLTEMNYTSKPIKTNQEVPTEQRIMSSKLPDEIKRLMIEHPINQPNAMSGPSLSNELVEKAARLMGTNSTEQYVPQKSKPQSSPQSNTNLNDIKSIVRETVEEVLRENGLLVESTQKASELISFKVGKHIFEGKVTKIKKLKE